MLHVEAKYRFQSETQLGIDLSDQCGCMANRDLFNTYAKCTPAVMSSAGRTQATRSERLDLILSVDARNRTAHEQGIQRRRTKAFLNPTIAANRNNAIGRPSMMSACVDPAIIANNA